MGRNFILAWVVIILGLWIIACSMKDVSNIKKTELEMYTGAERLYNDHSYEDAITAYESLLSTYPLTPYTVEAELKIADSYFKLKEYPEAVEEYLNFLKLHPAHAEIPFVMERIGESYYHQAPKTADRDLSHLEKAYDVFQELSIQYGATPPGAVAKKRILEIGERLANRAKYIGDFYFRRKKFLAAVGRYSEVVQLWPETTVTEAVHYRLVECYQKVGDIESLRATAKDFLAKYPHSEKVAEVQLKLQSTP